MNNKTKRIISFLIISLIASILLIVFFGFSNSTVVSKNTIYAEVVHGKTYANISLDKDNPEDEERFLTPYMFPGDVHEKEYRINVYYKGTINLFFRAYNTQFFDDLYDIRYDESGEIIAEYGPRIKVSIDDVIMYEGFIRDIPEYIVVERSQGSRKNQLVSYDISVSLDKEVSSDYSLDSAQFQDKEAYFDMEWWVEGGDPEIFPIPATGIDGIYQTLTNPNTYIVLIGLICIVLFLYFRRKRKDYER